MDPSNSYYNNYNLPEYVCTNGKSPEYLAAKRRRIDTEDAGIEDVEMQEETEVHPKAGILAAYDDAANREMREIKGYFISTTGNAENPNTFIMRRFIQQARAQTERLGNIGYGLYTPSPTGNVYNYIPTDELDTQEKTRTVVRMIQNDYIDGVESAIRKNPAVLSTRNEEGETPLQVALKLQKYHFVNALLDGVAIITLPTLESIYTVLSNIDQQSFALHKEIIRAKLMTTRPATEVDDQQLHACWVIFNNLAQK